MDRGYLLQDVLQPGIGLDVVQFGGLDERCGTGPCSGAFVMTGEECVSAIRGDGSGDVFGGPAQALDRDLRSAAVVDLVQFFLRLYAQ